MNKPSHLSAQCILSTRTGASRAVGTVSREPQLKNALGAKTFRSAASSAGWQVEGLRRL